jgi:uric acid-xanthine permease
MGACCASFFMQKLYNTITGDITAVYEASEMSTETNEYPESVQGGLTSDGFCSLLAGLFTSMPNTTFSQNNGVISLTKCASRRAGYACGFWLILMGVCSKFAGLITSIPDCVYVCRQW